MPLSRLARAELIKCAHHIIDPGSVSHNAINLYTYRGQLTDRVEITDFLRKYVEKISANRLTVIETAGYIHHKNEKFPCVLVVPFGEAATSDNVRTYVIANKIGGFRALREDEQPTDPV